MQGPGGEVGRATERIMVLIREHLKEDASGSPVHYNRAYEAVSAELEIFKVRIVAGNAIQRDRL